MEANNLSILSEQLLDHILGGVASEEFTCVYDRKTKQQYGAVDDSETGDVLRRIDDESSTTLS